MKQLRIHRGWSVTRAAVCLSGALLFLLSFLVNAEAVQPEFTILAPVTDYMDTPGGIALDSRERLYATEAGKNSVQVYSPGGSYVGAIRGIKAPISIAIDASDRIYIGSDVKGYVKVYDSDWNFLFYLGIGEGEFDNPGAIAVDSAGKIYVADSEKDKIDVYQSDGAYDFSFGGYDSAVPTPPGKFNFPNSIAIDGLRGEIIITDHARRFFSSGWYSGNVEASRVQIFNINDISSGPVRSYDIFGTGAEDVNTVAGVEVDEAGRIYVTDAANSIVQVYDNAGAHIKPIYDLSVPMRSPTGIVLGNSGRLFIASSAFLKKVDVYGLDNYEQMEVRPSSLNFQGQEGGAVPALQGIEVENTGAAVLNWTAVTGETWITLSSAAGSADSGQVSGMDAGVNLEGLVAGTYEGSIEITAGSGMTEEVLVTLTVTEPPELTVTPGSLEFTSVDGAAPGVQELSIDNTGGGTFNWTAVAETIPAGDGWLLIDKSGGTAGEKLTASVNITGLVPGTYFGGIEITAAGGVAGSPKVVPVKLDVIILEGDISVTTNLPEATFTISGPQSYFGSGTSFTVNNAPAGTYLIVYGDVKRYDKPVSESKVLQGGGSIVFNGVYTKKTGVKQYRSIVVGAGPYWKNDGLVKVINYDNSIGAEFTAHAYKYGVNVAAGDIDGDGIDEIITAPGYGYYNPAEIRVFDKDGNELAGMGITAYPYKYGAYIASADFDGDGRYEVVTGAGAGYANPAEVKVFVNDGAGFTDSGIDFLAYGTTYGVRVAAGDIDGDGIPEIITAPGPGRRNRGVIRIWKVDTSAGTGQWEAVLLREFTAESRYRASVTLACADINGDGVDEIITGGGPYWNSPDKVKLFGEYGELLLQFRTYMSGKRGYGVNVAGGDMDGDGVAEVIAGAGPRMGNKGVVKVFTSEGVMKIGYNALDTKYGANVASGEFGFKVVE